MRKFKIKNRQKRKYIKKVHKSPHYLSSNTIAIGLVPSVLLAAALCISLLIKYSNWTEALQNISIPPVYSLLVNFIHSLSIEIPKYHPPAVTPPQIPSVSYQPAMQVITALQQTVMNSAALVISSFVSVYKSIIDPIQTIDFTAVLGAYQQIINNFILSTLKMAVQYETGIFSLYRYSIDMNLFIIYTILTVFWNSILFWSSVFINVLSGVTKAIEDAGTMMDRTVISLLFVIRNFLILLFENIANLIISISEAILQFVTQVTIEVTSVATTLIGNSINALTSFELWITNGLNAILYFLGSPFRTAGHYMDEASPYIVIIVKLFIRAANDLVNNVALLANAAHNLKQQ